MRPHVRPRAAQDPRVSPGSAHLEKLADLPVGSRARVVQLHGDSDVAEQLRVLGLLPGTVFEVRRAAPLGDPIEIHYRGFLLAIRPDQADCLDVQRLPQ